MRQPRPFDHFSGRKGESCSRGVDVFSNYKAEPTAHVVAILNPSVVSLSPKGGATTQSIVHKLVFTQPTSRPLYETSAFRP